MDCVYCKQRGPFLKKGVMMWGKHHVKFCCKADDRKKAKQEANRRNPTFTEEGGGWRRKCSAKKKNKNRVTIGAKNVLKMSCDTFGILGAKTESERLKQETNEKHLKETELKKIRAAAAAKKAPRPSIKKSPAFGGWLAVAKAPKPVTKKERKMEVPLVASPKRVDALKKQAKAKSSPTVFKKGAVMSFEEVHNMFSNTDSWGDSDEEC